MQSCVFRSQGSKRELFKNQSYELHFWIERQRRDIRKKPTRCIKRASELKLGIEHFQFSGWNKNSCGAYICKTAYFALTIGKAHQDFSNDLSAMNCERFKYGTIRVRMPKSITRRASEKTDTHFPCDLQTPSNQLKTDRWFTNPRLWTSNFILFKTPSMTSYERFATKGSASLKVFIEVGKGPMFFLIESTTNFSPSSLNFTLKTTGPRDYKWTLMAESSSKLD